MGSVVEAGRRGVTFPIRLLLGSHLEELVGAEGECSLEDNRFASEWVDSIDARGSMLQQVYRGQEEDRWSMGLNYPAFGVSKRRVGTRHEGKVNPASRGRAAWGFPGRYLSFINSTYSTTDGKAQGVAIR
ncbi:conserved hypothetical protein [Histoplasma capsulatum H143]|uniref:Uncharacterized protein n=1 Tax=Ajellomyces capsulatus (strain H143) TaxID=544712 RepID=C6HN44_AJECH|nr:conserved hypothetical protein [Histoplasma capsulatum H143]